MAAAEQAQVALASGRRSVVRALGDAEARDLWESTASLLPAERTTAALRLCLVGDGDGSPDPLDLTVGERDALLLNSRALSAGDAIPCVLDCPACGLALELELSTAALLAPAEPEVCPGLRPVTGGDLEWASRLALSDPAEAAAGLVRRCLTDGGARSLSDTELADALERADPHAELTLEAECPNCGESFASVFDPSAYVFAELAQRAARLERDVHALALAYHWSETDILRLSPDRRRRYLDLVGAA